MAGRLRFKKTAIVAGVATMALAAAGTVNAFAADGGQFDIGISFTPCVEPPEGTEPGIDAARVEFGYSGPFTEDGLDLGDFSIGVFSRSPGGQYLRGAAGLALNESHFGSQVVEVVDGAMIQVELRQKGKSPAIAKDIHIFPGC